jgi:hypothetical protein
LPSSSAPIIGAESEVQQPCLREISTTQFVLLDARDHELILVGMEELRVYEGTEDIDHAVPWFHEACLAHKALEACVAFVAKNQDAFGHAQGVTPPLGGLGGHDREVGGRRTSASQILYGKTV